MGNAWQWSGEVLSGQDAIGWFLGTSLEAGAAADVYNIALQQQLPREKWESLRVLAVPEPDSGEPSILIYAVDLPPDLETTWLLLERVEQALELDISSQLQRLEGGRARQLRQAVERVAIVAAGDVSDEEAVLRRAEELATRGAAE